jgi:hypothetical protein
MNSGEDKINMKIVAFDEIYNFVLQTFFIWSHIGVQNIDIPSRSTVHLPPFPVVVGTYRHLPRRFETTFANFWIRYLFSKHHKKIKINKKTPEEGGGERTHGPVICTTQFDPCYQISRDPTEAQFQFFSVYYSWSVFLSPSGISGSHQFDKSIELPSLIFWKNVKNTPPAVWQKTLEHVNIRARLTVGIVVCRRWEGEKDINNREGFMMQVFKRWKSINIILFLSGIPM